VQLCGDEETNGQTLIDDEYLLRRGASTEDLKKYRFDPDVEPPRLLANDAEANDDWDVRRGSVKALREDRARSRL
jgi:hypothetical protein